MCVLVVCDCHTKEGEIFHIHRGGTNNIREGGQIYFQKEFGVLINMLRCIYEHSKYS